MSFYDVLEINENADQEIIEKAHKKIISKNNLNDEKIEEINKAYDTLINPEKKSMYDLVRFKLKNCKAYKEYNKKHHQ